MSESIFETFTDERGNISVRISQEVQVLTREEANRIEAEYRRMQAEHAKLRELARSLHMAYIETLNECESVNEELIWECSGSIDDDIAKSKARFEVNRHRFDDALCELGVGVDE